MAGEEDEIPLLRERNELVGFRAAERGRLLDEDVLPGREGAAGELVVRRNRGRDDDGLDGRVLEHVVEAVGHSGIRISRAVAITEIRGEVAEPREVGEVVEVRRGSGPSSRGPRDRS